MYIAYLYIESFDGLKDQEFCFSNQFHISHTKREGKDVIDLKIQANPEYIENFWSIETGTQSPIRNVSALVGSNGSGKTRLLKALWIIANMQPRFEPSTRIFGLLLDDVGESAIGVTTYGQKFELTGINYQQEFINNEDYKEHYPSCWPIYYSPAIQAADSMTGLDWKFGANVSQSYWWFQKLLDSNKNKTRNEYRTDEVREQILFLRELAKHKLKGFDEPRLVICTFRPLFHKPRNSSRIDDQKMSADRGYKQLYNLISKDFQGSYLSNPSKEEYTLFTSKDDYTAYLVRAGIILHILTFRLTKLFYYRKLLPILETIGTESKTTIDAIWNRFGIDDQFKHPKTGWLKDRANELFNFINHRLQLDDKSGVDVQRGVEAINFSVEVKDFARLLHLERQLLGEDIYNVKQEQVDKDKTSSFLPIDLPFEFSFMPPPSTGIQALLTLFARLRTGIEDVHHKSVKLRNDPLKDRFSNILVLLDEAEANLHPEYQSEFLGELLRIIPELVPQDITIQLILSTHSPIILSDLPKNSVLYLLREGQMKPNNSTFGANIHSLFQHEFFLNSAIGTFAKSKIDGVLKDLKNPTSKLDFDKVDRLISMIGEDVLKAQLETYSKFKRLEQLGSDQVAKIRRKSKKHRNGGKSGGN